MQTDEQRPREIKEARSGPKTAEVNAKWRFETRKAAFAKGAPNCGQNKKGQSGRPHRGCQEEVETGGAGLFERKQRRRVDTVLRPISRLYFSQFAILGVNFAFQGLMLRLGTFNFAIHVVNSAILSAQNCEMDALDHKIGNAKWQNATKNC